MMIEGKCMIDDDEDDAFALNECVIMMIKHR